MCGTDDSVVLAAVGEDGWQIMRDFGLSLRWAQGTGAWRGFRHRKYLKGCNAQRSHYESDEEAIKH
eukprot:862385-Karenia_brevis.AAC.1